MSYFLRNGNTFRVTDERNMDLHDRLPVGNFIVKVDQYGNFFLEQIDGFTRPAKVYGDTLRNTDRILRTFMDRSASTGVMLTGEKGSGKSLLAKNLAITAADTLEVPTIVINSAYHGDGFNKLLQDINQPCIVLFDEFEKVYDRDEQESILTLLDGVFPSKKLFVLTCNDKWRVDQHMRNRPGRIFYMIDYKGLSAEFIEEYCNDNLIAKEHTEAICKIASMFDQFNFDMLKALVEEMNRYNETPQEALRMLNAKPEFDGGSTYDVEVRMNGKVVNVGETWRGNPLGPEGVEHGFYAKTGTEAEDDDGNWYHLEFGQRDLLNIDARAGKFVFESKDGTITLTRQKEITYNYYAF